ncbi:MAG TPA: hypothetical protein VF820_06265 [Patescibacteria group bacterium]
MHKRFYASGFIYHLPSQLILLQQPQSIDAPWVLFEKEYEETKQPEDIFQNVISKSLNIKVKNIHKIYSYTEGNLKNYSLFYATVNKLEDFPPKNGYIFRWFTFKEILKIRTTDQTKHNIVVGQRVIESTERKERGEQTLE